MGMKPRLTMLPFQPMIDVLIVNYNTSSLLAPMFEALDKAAQGLPVRHWLVDNASSDDSVAVLRARFPDVNVIENRVNIGFGRANNLMLPGLEAPYALLLNTDAFVAPQTLRVSLEFMQRHQRCGVLGVKLIGREGDLQPSCRYFPTPFNVFLGNTGLGRWFSGVRMVDDMSWDHASARACDWVPGCYYLVRREVLEQVGLFDPRYFLYYEEVDHCRRVKAAGWDVMYCPDTHVVHIGGESAKSAGVLSASGRQLSALQIESELLYFRKHHGVSGLVSHLLLVVIADGYLAVKDVLKGRGRAAALQKIKHLGLAWSLSVKTRWGTTPTR